MAEKLESGVYGIVPEGLVDAPEGAVQLSPLVPGARSLEALVPAALDGCVMLAPAGTLERRYAMALALRAVAPGGACTFLAPKQRGGARLAEELRQFGCDPQSAGRRHHRICTFARPAELQGIEAALAEGGPRLVAPLGLWSQPGVFSWDRSDPGSALLAEQIGGLAGRGVDFGCGIGVLAHAVLASSRVASLDLIDIDHRAIEAARRNVADMRARFHWADARQPLPGLERLDFVVMNPPFHHAGVEDQALGQSFITRAAAVLRTGGTLWLTANRHLPYEAVLKPLFRQVTLRAEALGYKIVEARK